MSNNHNQKEQAMADDLPARPMGKSPSVTLSGFLQTTPLDNATIDLLKKYDQDGDGHFSKNEVVDIIMDLRQEINNNEHLGQANKVLRRAIIAAIVFCVFLLSSMFGLIYAVAALTAKIDVNPQSGVMTTPDGKHVVATDSVAYRVVTSTNEGSGVQCLDHTEFGELIQRVANGNSVTMEMHGTGIFGNQTQLQKLSGSIQMEDGQVCFKDTSGQEICATPSSDCVTTQNGRRLVSTIDACKGAYTAYSSMLGVFGYMVAGADICIRGRCSSDVLSTSPRVYSSPDCVCQCAVESGVEFALSFSTR